MAREFVALFKSMGAEKIQGDFDKIGKSTETLDKGLGKASDTATRSKRRFSELGSTVGDLGRTLVGLGVVKWFGDAAMGAAQFENSLRGLTSVLGQATATNIQQWLEDNGDALNVSQEAGIAAARSLSIYAKGIQDAGGDAEGFTEDLITLAAALGKFSGADPTEVLDALQSALRGEFDPLEKFGIALKQSQIAAEAVKEGIAGVGDTLTQAQQAQATYTLLMEDGAFAMDAMSDSSGGLTSSVADLKQKLSDLQLSVGQGLAPALEGVAAAAGVMFDAFNKLPGPVRTAVVVLGGLVILNRTLGPALAGIGTSLRNLRTEVAASQGLGAKLKTGLSGATAAINPWMLAITGGLTLLSLWASRSTGAEKATIDWTNAIDKNTGAINKNGIQQLTNDLADYSDEAQTTGVSVRDLAAAVGDQDAYESMSERLHQLIEDHTTTRVVNYRTVKSLDDTALAALGLSRELDNLHGGYTGAVEDGKNTAAVHGEVAAAVTGESQAMADLAKKVKDTGKAYQDTLDDFTAFNDAVSGRRSTIYDYEGALDDLRESLGKGGTFAPTAEQGRANWDKLVKAAQTASDRIRTALETGGAKSANTVYTNSRDTLHRMLTNAGVQSQQAWNLVNSVLTKPHQMHVEIDKTDRARLHNDLAKLEHAGAKITAKIDLPPESAVNQRIANTLNQVAPKLKPIQAKIETDLTNLDEKTKDLDQAANPDGRPRPANIDARVDPGSLATSQRQLDYLARDRDTTITVHTVTVGGGGGSGPKPRGVAPQLLGVTPQIAPPVTYAPSVTVPAPAPAAPQRVQLAPRQTPVVVMLDGAVIADHLELKARRLASVGAIRRLP